MHPIQALVVFSSLMAACASIPRPNADTCTANVPALHLRCYNLRDDYDGNGELRPGARAHYFPCEAGRRCEDPATHYQDEAAMLAELNKMTVFTPDAWAAVKAWIRELRGAVAQMVRQITQGQRAQ